MSTPYGKYYPSLTPLYGLGSYGRVIGAQAISSPRSGVGSAVRIYNALKAQRGSDYALHYFKSTIYGPYVINKAGTGLILG
jgi:hypothetical protein